MDVHAIIYGIFGCFIGLSVSAILSFSKGFSKKASWLFVAANAVGFLSGAAYLMKYAGQDVALFRLDWLFGFSPAIGTLSAVFFTLITAVSALAGIYGVKYLAMYKDVYDTASTQFLTSVFVSGMLGVLFANNTFSFMLFWEVMSIASFFLVMADGLQESVKAAFIYFIMTHLGASAILAGFLILGGGTLSFDFSNIPSATAAMPSSLLALSFILFFFGFGSKAGLVPFHVWLPEAHPQAPSNISALMSGLMLKVAVYGFIKVIFGFAGLPQWAGMLVIALGLLSGLIGALYAVISRDMKRAFAYSSIENMGIIFTMLGFSLYLHYQNGGEKIEAISAAIIAFALFHAINHAVFKTALFLSSGVVISRVHTKNMELMGGLAKIMPVFSFVFLLGILSSLPIPPFGAFYGEWGLIQNIIALFHSSTVGTNAFVVAVSVLGVMGLVSGLAVFAMIKIFGISMLGLSRAKHLEARNEKTERMLVIPIFALGLLSIVLGIFAKPMISWLMSNLNVFSVQTAAARAADVSSLSVFLIPAMLLALVYAIYGLVVKDRKERKYHTWDCGQPINAGMEYTATAFSAPIRFFFLYLLRRTKVAESVPVVATNPWIRNYSFSLSIRPIFKDSLYEPAARILKILAERAKIIQSGRIQYYLLFLFATLIITLLIAL